MTIKATFTKNPAFLSAEIGMELSSLSDFDKAIEDLKAIKEAFALFQRTPAFLDNTNTTAPSE